jgi:hypothetical protein
MTVQRVPDLAKASPGERESGEVEVEMEAVKMMKLTTASKL